MTNSNTKLPFGEKFGYGLGDAASNLYFQTLMLFITYYYTDVFGLPASTVAAVLLLPRLWDVINDPIMGIIADRTNSRWGKFRPYIIIFALPLAIAGVVTFTTPDLESTGKIIYAFCSFSVLMMLYTAVNVPYSALMGVMSPSPEERTSASQFRFVLAFAGQLIVSYGTLKLVKYFGEGNEQVGWQWTMGAFGILAAILLALTFFTTKERVQPPKDQKANTLKDLGDLFKNKPWVLIAIATVFQLFYAVMRGNATPFYFKYFVLDQQWSIFGHSIDLSIANFTTYFATVGSLSTLIGALAAKFCSKILDKKNAYSGFLIGSSVVSCGFFLLQPQNILLIFSFNVVLSFCMGIVSVLQWAIYTDTVDYGEWKFGRRATGLIMAASLFALKLGLTFGGTIVTVILWFHGYEANMEQTEFSLVGIRMLMSFYPAVFGIIGGVVMIFYPLKNSVLLKIEQDLDARRK